jgi:hypothetical protein
MNAEKFGCERYVDEPDFPGCCVSCHVDEEDFGYWMCVDPNDENNEVCCNISFWLKEKEE